MYIVRENFISDAKKFCFFFRFQKKQKQNRILNIFVIKSKNFVKWNLNGGKKNVNVAWHGKENTYSHT